MAMLVLSNDLTNAHHVHDADLYRLVNDCLVRKVQGHEAQAVFECERRNGSQPAHIFHIVTSIPSDGYDEMTQAVKRSNWDPNRVMDRNERAG